MQVTWLIQELKVYTTFATSPLLWSKYINCYDLFNDHYANDNLIKGIKNGY